MKGETQGAKIGLVPVASQEEEKKKIIRWSATRWSDQPLFCMCLCSRKRSSAVKSQMLASIPEDHTNTCL